MPRMLEAYSKASSAVLASFTPPALPRPPALTCALITVTPPSCSAAALAASAVSTTTPSVVVTPCLAKSSFAWYSIRSTDPPSPLCRSERARALPVTGGCHVLRGCPPHHRPVSARTTRSGGRDVGHGRTVEPGRPV